MYRFLDDDLREVETCRSFYCFYANTKIVHFWLVIIKYDCAGDKMEKNEMDGACSSDGGGERRAQGFGGET
jgi:hypothetical protein